MHFINQVHHPFKGPLRLTQILQKLSHCTVLRGLNKPSNVLSGHVSSHTVPRGSVSPHTVIRGSVSPHTVLWGSVSPLEVQIVESPIIFHLKNHHSFEHLVI